MPEGKMKAGSSGDVKNKSGVDMTGWQINRRTFLCGSAAGALSLMLDLRLLSPRPAQADRGNEQPDYRGWEDVYRERWTWDRVAVSTHADSNCVASCTWQLYVRDNVIWREEQTAHDKRTNATLPDFNPAGCQKGAVCSQLMQGPSRLRYPLRRVGKRGEGRWQRISWDEALAELSGTLVDTLARRGGEGVVCEMGSNSSYSVGYIGTARFFRQIGAPVVDPFAQIGDVPVGGTITLGIGLTGGSADNWFQSRYLVIWEFNPICTRIPYAHFLTEARYRGAKVVTIAPDYSPSAIHSDVWLSPRPGTDTALALAACRVMIEENLYKADYVREQTDLPFLVRTDTRAFLREADVEPDGRQDRFAWWDETRQALLWAPGTMGSEQPTLQIPAGTRPALEAKRMVRLASGKEVEVRTVFSLLRERLNAYEPEKAAKITGVSAATIRQFAHGFAAAPSAMILFGFGQAKHYHGDLLMRAELLMLALTGNLGRPGGGWDTPVSPDMLGTTLVFLVDEVSKLDGLAPGQPLPKLDDPNVSLLGLPNMISGTLFLTVHGGLRDQQTAPAYGDPGLRRSPDEYLKDALAKGARGGYPMVPPPGAEPPEIIFNLYGNPLRSSRMGDRIRETLFTKAKLIVDIGIRMSETARHADILLPAAGYYEKVAVKIPIMGMPGAALGDRVVPPLGESKSEWEIFSLLAERVGAEASRRGLNEVRGCLGQACAIAKLGARFSDHGYFGPQDDEKICRLIMRVSRPTAGVSLEDLRARGGAVRYPDAGPEDPLKGLFSEYRSNEPLVPLRDFVDKKQPYPTLTGRQQFYIDAPVFREVGEELPVFKEPPMMGGKYPFTLTGGHTRWSIHAIYRDQELLLRLQRGEPVAYVNEKDARELGIADHDYVRISNDVGSFVARAKPTGSIRPKQILIYHAWEPYQFRGANTHQYLSPSPLKVTQLVTDYGHLQWRPGGYYDVNQVDRDTRVKIGKA